MYTALTVIGLILVGGGAICLMAAFVLKSAIAGSLVIPCLLIGFLCRVFAEILERLIDLQERVGEIEMKLKKED